MLKVLLTGFEPFHGASSNPSQEVIKFFAEERHPNIETLVLPVVFGEASRLVITKIDQIKPDVVISLGQAEGRNQITPERVAINIDDARIADNAGNQPKDQKITEHGDDGYFSTLPLQAMVDAIKAVGVPAAISLSAGTFVCNHLFYAVQHHCKGRGIRSGFIHLPLMESQASEFPGLFTMKLEDMVKGIKAAISVL